jgi:hypothetical protein
MRQLVNGVSVEMTEAEEREYWRLMDEAAPKSVRATRNALLAESDWLVIMHTEKGTNIPAEWELYRQALRDIPEQEGFPYQIDWPVKPD